MNIPILGPLVSLGETWLKGKQEKSAAKSEREAELIRQRGSWEEIMAEGAGASWKDEWLTILFSIPLILAFIPAAVPYVAQGFATLDLMPTWYKNGLGVIVAASFGVRNATSLFSNIAKVSNAKKKPSE